MASFLLTKCLCLLFKFFAFSSLFLFISDDDNIKHPDDNEEAAVDEICHQQIKFNFTPTQVKEAQRVHFSFINLFLLLDSKKCFFIDLCNEHFAADDFYYERCGRYARRDEG